MQDNHIQNENRQGQELDFALAFGSAVHDVKNSVGMLLSSLDEFMTSNPPQSDEDNRQAVILNYEASRINNDMMQLLSIYRLENERLFMSVESVMVKEFVEDELLAHQTLFDMKDIEVELQCDEGLSWYFDSMLLRNVMHNVVINTIRYTEDKLLITAGIDNGYLVISVEDNGRGYPDHLCQDPGGYLTRINSNTGSSGLGLYFSAKAAEMHRNGDRAGSIEICNDSTIGGGCFRVYLP